jgi:cell division protein FtsB
MGRVSNVLSWLLPFGLLVLAIVAVPLRILDEQGLPRYRALKDELREVSAQNDRLEREVRDLLREVEGLENDPVAIERIARDELGMVREGELVFQFSE